MTAVLAPVPASGIRPGDVIDVDGAEVTVTRRTEPVYGVLYLDYAGVSKSGVLRRTAEETVQRIRQAGAHA